MSANARASRADDSAVAPGREASYLRSHYFGALTAAEWILLAVLLTIFLKTGFLPAWRTLKSEFPNYYLAAELYHQNIPLDRVYEWTWFQRQNDHLGVYRGLVSFAPNPPTFVLAFIPFTRLQPLAAKRVWIILSLVFLALSLWILHRVTRLSWRRLVLISLFCIVPLRVDFLYGRPYVFLLFLICAAYYASRLNLHRTSGGIWAAAAVMKLFPALAVILLVGKRNWRALSGFLTCGAGLLTISYLMLGREVHRVFLLEILSQTSRGDWLGTYVLAQNSFSTLWSHLFRFEPELNPSPLINSPSLYAVTMGITVTVLVFPFLISLKSDKASRATPLHWAALVPLLLLLSTTSAPDYSCLLIFTTIVGFDVLLEAENKKVAFAVVFFYVLACAPVPHRISDFFPLSRLVATTALYALLLRSTGIDLSGLLAKRWLIAGLALTSLLTLYNLRKTTGLAEDFTRRLPTPPNGYRFANPVPLLNGLAFTKMQLTGYEIGLLTNGAYHDVSVPGDALSVAGAETDPNLYTEVTGHESTIARLAVEQPGVAPEFLTEGQDPALSFNAKWLDFIREQFGRRTAWLSATDFAQPPQMLLPSAYEPLEVTVTNDGDVIAAAGDVSDPRLFLVRHGTFQITELPGFPHPARYPALCPDGRRLAFTRRDGGAWHLVVRDLTTGQEQQLTHASCNAFSPAWQNNQTLLYATDCGRGVGLTAIARVVLPN